MHPMVNMALRAARDAAEIIRRAYERLDRIDVESKGHNDFVTEVDRAAEQAIIRVIQKAYPKHGILAEESGEIEGSEDYQWIIDPLDGTTNFIHGFPQFAVSIGIKHKNQIEHGVIVDPIKEEEFSASRGRGAQMNGKRLRVTNRKTFEGALLGTGFPFRDDQEPMLDPYLASFRELMIKTAGIRRAGSAALDLAYVAAGRLDGYWEFGLQPWDIAAGALLVQESGGLVGEPNGGHGFLDSGNLVCGNPKLFKQLLQTLHPHVSGKV